MSKLRDLGGQTYRQTDRLVLCRSLKVSILTQYPIKENNPPFLINQQNTHLLFLILLIFRFSRVDFIPRYNLLKFHCGIIIQYNQFSWLVCIVHSFHPYVEVSLNLDQPRTGEICLYHLNLLPVYFLPVSQLFLGIIQIHCKKFV